MSGTLFAVGGAIFVVLGVLHGLYTLLDLRHPRRLVPIDADVMRAMQGTGVRLARGSAGSMWQAWIGFNLSHSLGAIVFGLGAAAWSLWPAPVPLWQAAVPTTIGLLYAAIGWRCWFWIPNTGIALATLCFALAAIVTR